MSDEGSSFLACLRRERVQLGLLILFALAVHLPKLGVSVGSPDEEGGANNVGAIQICQESLTRITTDFYKAQNHPLFSILGHFAVKYVPVSPLVAARLPALVAGLLVPPVFYFTQRAWVGREAAMVVAFLLVVTDPLHHYVTAARGYSMLVLGSLLMNQLLLGYLRRPGSRVLAGYGLVAVATAYTHLWGLLIFVAHAVYLGGRCTGAMVSKSRGERVRVAIGVWIGGMSALLGAAALTLLLYRPMLGDVLAMAGAQRASRLDAVRVLGDNLLQLARFRDWTLAAYVLLVPIVVEGFARRLRRGGLDEVCWFHLTVVTSAAGVTLVAPPQNFDSRFLMPLIPSAASLVAWGLSGYWRASGEAGERVLPRTATWLGGFALGIVVSNASMTVDIPVSALTSHTDESGEDHGYFYRNLPKAVGSAAGWCLLGIAMGLVCVLRCSGLPAERFRAESLRIGLCSALLLTSLPLLALGPSYSQYVWGLPGWVFEVHLVSTALIWLLAWEHRFDAPVLHRLRYALLVTLVVVAAWQLGGDRLRWDAWSPVRLLAIVPPVVVSVAVARERERARGRVGE